jgi:hypothetical protein
VEPRFDHVLQLEVRLEGLRQPVWRRVLLPCTYSFWDLHVAIQDAMGWEDRHLHAFSMVVPLTQEGFEIGIPDSDDPMSEESALPGWQVPIAGFFTLISRKGGYCYDMGDSWEHSILLERILPRDESTEYPICTAGEGACPPEDCGGAPGYLAMLDEGYEPPVLDRSAIRFRDPSLCLKSLLGELGGR